MQSGIFESIFAAGLAAVRSGSHGIESDPRTTGRWGPSIVLRPDGVIADRLSELTSTAGGILDGEHWRSGALGRAHLTVRTLAPYTESIEADRLERYQAALHSAVRKVGPLRFDFGGLGVSSGSLMVCANPQTSAPATLRALLGAELGPDGRDPIWYCSLLHFVSTLKNTDGFIDWVADHADKALGTYTFRVVDVCWWRYDGEGMAPQVAASVEAKSVS